LEVIFYVNTVASKKPYGASAPFNPGLALITAGGHTGAVMRLIECPTENEWIDALAADLVRALDGVAEPRLCLAGGTTPEPFYEAAARVLAGRGDGAPAYLVVGDERLGAIGPSERNATMIRRAFAPALESGRARLVAWGTTGDTGSMRLAMEARLADLRRPDRPLFDLCYLGLGADGHAAGLFTGADAAEAGSVVLTTAPARPRARVSLSAAVIRNTAATRFVVRRRGKEAALERLLAGDPSCPAVAVCTGETVVYALDEGDKEPCH